LWRLSGIGWQLSAGLDLDEAATRQKLAEGGEVSKVVTPEPRSRILFPVGIATSPCKLKIEPDRMLWNKSRLYPSTRSPMPPIHELLSRLRKLNGAANSS